MPSLRSGGRRSAHDEMCCASIDGLYYSLMFTTWRFWYGMTLEILHSFNRHRAGQSLSSIDYVSLSPYPAVECFPPQTALSPK
jgi:hypothetical protein